MRVTGEPGSDLRLPLSRLVAPIPVAPGRERRRAAVATGGDRDVAITEALPKGVELRLVNELGLSGLPGLPAHTVLRQPITKSLLLSLYCRYALIESAEMQPLEAPPARMIKP
jgi:hypothetical protein